MDTVYDSSQKSDQPPIITERAYDETVKLGLEQPDVFLSALINDILHKYNQDHLLQIKDSVIDLLKKFSDAHARDEEGAQRENIASQTTLSNSLANIQVVNDLQQPMQVDATNPPVVPNAPHVMADPTSVLENHQVTQQKKVRLASDKIYDTVGPHLRPSVIWQPSFKPSLWNNARPYEGKVETSIKPKLAISNTRISNPNFEGMASISNGSQEEFSVDNGFLHGTFPVVINTNKSFYVTVKIAPGIDLSKLKISTCKKLVFSLEKGLGVHFVADNENYIRFHLRLLDARDQSGVYLLFNVDNLGSKSFNSPVFDVSATAISSECKDFFKRQNIKVVLNDLSVLFPFPRAFMLPAPPPHAFARRPWSIYSDHSMFTDVSFVIMASVIPIRARFILIDTLGNELEISSIEGPYGECLLYANDSIVTTSNLLLRRGVYRCGFYCNRKETQFIIDLNNYSINLIESPPLLSVEIS